MPAKNNKEMAKATPRTQLNKYLNEVSTMTVPSNIFKFWQENRREFPALFILSTHTLCVLASSATVERIFSAGGNAITESKAIFGNA